MGPCRPSKWTGLSLDTTQQTPPAGFPHSVFMVFTTARCLSTSPPVKVYFPVPHLWQEGCSQCQACVIAVQANAVYFANNTGQGHSMQMCHTFASKCTLSAIHVVQWMVHNVEKHGSSTKFLTQSKLHCCTGQCCVI